MGSRDRNKLCECGSGLKRKKCYELSREECSVYIKERNINLLKEHPQKEKEVMKFFKESLSEVNSAFLKNDNKEDILSSRIQLIIIFVFVDILSSFLFFYIDNKDNAHKKRFLLWIDEYFFNLKNEAYLKNKDDLKGVTSELLYSLRSSLTHFFGLPEPNDEISFFLLPNSVKNEEIMVPIKSQIIFDIVRTGAKVMLEEWIENINSNKEDVKINHVLGINRIHKKIHIDGGFLVRKEEWENIIKN
jgi:hypothetical protein